MSVKNIAILGSTGSIGTQTLEVVRNNKDMNVVALAAGRNIKCLEEQIREFHPRLVCVWDEMLAKELEKNIADIKVDILYGMDGLIACSTLAEVDIVVAAIVGMIGIQPTIAAIKAGKDIALANKETLVTAGHIIMPLIKEYQVSLLPVDSEHSAIFQCLQGIKEQKNEKQVDKIMLTASGGPFRGKKLEQLKNIQPEDALKHPNWEMGRKITIDSSTLVNKGLEVIEAKWLFDINYDQIQVVVQPQSIIHSMVQFSDGAVMAQLGTPDMKLPIQYALCYPERRQLSGERLNFWEIENISFMKPDTETFRGLSLAYEAGRCGGSMPTVFNAANEKAVDMFLEKQIGYLDITDSIEEMMKQHQVLRNPSVEDILAIEKDVYQKMDQKWR